MDTVGDTGPSSGSKARSFESNSGCWLQTRRKGKCPCASRHMCWRICSRVYIPRLDYRHASCAGLVDSGCPAMVEKSPRLIGL